MPHGLRKNAVNVMLECGCQVAEVSSITGQSFQMVEHYAKRVNRKRLARTAMLKFERGTNPAQETELETAEKQRGKTGR